MSTNVYCLWYFTIRWWVKQSLCAFAKIHVWCTRDCVHVFLLGTIGSYLSFFDFSSLEGTLISAPHWRFILFNFTKVSNIAQQRLSHMICAKKIFSKRNNKPSSPSSTPPNKDISALLFKPMFIFPLCTQVMLMSYLNMPTEWLRMLHRSNEGAKSW